MGPPGWRPLSFQTKYTMSPIAERLSPGARCPFLVMLQGLHIDRTLELQGCSCKRCEKRAGLPLDAIRRPRDTPLWKLQAARYFARQAGTKNRL
jgi:hypothetical protein